MIQLIAYVVGIPCAIVVAVLLPFWLTDRKTINTQDLSARMSFGAGLGCMLAYMAGQWGQDTLPKFPPIDAAHWLFYLALPFGLIAALDAMSARSDKTAAKFSFSLFLLRAVISAVAVWLVLTPIRRNQPENVWTFVPAISAALLLQWESWAAIARRNRSFDTAAAVFVVVVGTSRVISLSGGAKYAMLCGTLTAIAGAIFVGSLLFPKFPLARGMSMVVAPLGFLYVVLGHFLTDVPLSCAVLLTAAAFAAWIAELPFVKRLKPWQIAVVRLIFIAVLVGIAVGIATANQPESY